MARSRKTRFTYGFGSNGFLSKDYFPIFMGIYSCLMFAGIIYVIYRLRAALKKKNQLAEEEEAKKPSRVFTKKLPRKVDDVSSESDAEKDRTPRNRKQPVKKVLKKRSEIKMKNYSSSSECEEKDNFTARRRYKAIRRASED